MNCWEFVLFAAYKGGFIDKNWIETLYKDAASKTGMDVPQTIEDKLTSRKGGTYDRTVPGSPKPLRGDIIIFGSAANHVAISIGGNEIMSLFTQNGYRVVETTIEAIMGSRTTVDFYTAPW